jgi:arginine decarboxylase
VTRCRGPLREWLPVERIRIDDVLEIYGIDNWGAGYFGVSNRGELTVHPTGEERHRISLLSIVETLWAQGLTTPLLLRFPQILESQVGKLCSSFAAAIQEFDYPRRYRPVYPLKVNQQRPVVEALLSTGARHGLGLEVGSKPELLGALAFDTPPGALLTCNGFKDAEYLRLAFLGARLGREVVVVLEKPYELEHYLAVARHQPDRPAPGIGFRIRLNSRGSGKWEKSGGITSKFGLTTAALLAGLRRLEAEGMIDRLRMLHFHIGSQITEIRRLKNAIKEAARVYAKVRKLGIPVELLNVGGGLGVDYDGSKTSSDASVNYTIQEYANDVVYTVGEVCAEEDVPPPDLVSESGRALVTYHSMLVVDVQAAIQAGDDPQPEARGEPPRVIEELEDVRRSLTAKNYREYYHDALELRDEMYSLFNLGMLDLEDRARGERAFWDIAQTAVRHARREKFFADEFVDLDHLLHGKLVCNFSVFQSIPDHWALDQLFPVVPIHRLRERPTVRATLVDITCDSDGEVEKFVDLKDIKDALEVHRPPHPPQQQPYYLAFLLVGAYQDVMGDLHNLFGAPNEAHVLVDERGEATIQGVRPGNTVRQTLEAFGYDVEALTGRIESLLKNRTDQGSISGDEARGLLEEYRTLFDAYTYLTPQTS